MALPRRMKMLIRPVLIIVASASLTRLSVCAADAERRYGLRTRRCAVAPSGDGHGFTRPGLPRSCTVVHHALRHGATRCNSATCCNPVSSRAPLYPTRCARRNAVRCCMFASCCRLPMRIGTWPRCAAPPPWHRPHEPRRVAACNAVLRCCAPCCTVLYCVANKVHHVATSRAAWRNVARTPVLAR